MLAPIWSHMITTSYLQSEIGPNDDGRPFSEVWPKTHDGLYMASTWDQHPLAIADAASLTRLARMHAAAGRNVRPWCVVKGLDPEAEGALAAQMALAASEGNLTHDAVIIIDLEPYYHGGKTPQFWRSDLFSDGADRARRLLDAFLANGGQTAWIAGDVRQAHLAPVSYDAWASHPAVSLHTPQTYYTIFDGNPDTPVERARMHIDRANALLAGMGVEPGRIGHILPAEGNAGVLGGAIGYCYSLGQLKPSLWQRVNIPATTCDSLLAAADPWAGAASEPVQPKPEKPRVGRETRIEPLTFDGGANVHVEWGDADDERVITISIPPISGKVRLVRDS